MNVLKKIRRKLGLNRSSLVSRLPRHLQYIMRCDARQRNLAMMLKPKTFNQKLAYKIVFDHRPLLVTFADKMLAREYVRLKVGEDILVELHAVATRPEDIQFDKLPQRFVLKTNHGSGYVRIVKDKSKEDESNLRRICRGWITENYGELTGEWVYKSIKPTIMVERFLEAGNGDVAHDYKFFVFNGKVFMVQVDVDRFIGHRNAVFTPDWERVPVRYLCPPIEGPVPRPACLEKMLKISELLGAETDFVRVDLYEVDGKVYFGELTNFPWGGGMQFEPPEFDAVLGAQWKITGYQPSVIGNPVVPDPVPKNIFPNTDADRPGK